MGLMTDGHFGPWTVEGPALTLDEIKALDEGTEVECVWSGGNGPHRYLVVFDGRGEPYLLSKHVDPDGPMRFYNPVGDFLGDEPPFTVIRLVR
jgi:hypothetical protein